MGHDQRFKEFLHEFLQDFLKLFYPDVEAQLDFQNVKFHDKEVFTDFAEGSRREADIVAELGTHEGRPELVVIHVEVQFRRERGFEARMFEYYSLLWSRHKLPIFPIVIYLHGGKEGLATEEYRMQLFGREVLRFRYESVRLARLSVEEYVKRGGPVGAALGALMDRSMSRDPAELRASMLLRVVESGLDDARQFLLVDLIETYFELAAGQLESYKRMISRKEYSKVQDVELTWAEKLLLQGEEKGREQGLQAGLVKGKRESVLRVLRAKFGPLSEQITARVATMESAEELDGCLDRILTATSLEETGLDA